MSRKSLEAFVDYVAANDELRSSLAADRERLGALLAKRGDDITGEDVREAMVAEIGPAPRARGELSDGQLGLIAAAGDKPLPKTAPREEWVDIGIDNIGGKRPLSPTESIRVYLGILFGV